MKYSDVKTYYVQTNSDLPGRYVRPVLFYPGAIKGASDDSKQNLFDENVEEYWFHGSFDYQHYHSSTHEVLGVIQGTVLIELGSQETYQIEVNAGDILVLPAGTTYSKLYTSPDFKAAGLYRDGMYHSGDAEDYASLHFSEEPLYGTEGPFFQLSFNI